MNFILFYNIQLLNTPCVCLNTKRSLRHSTNHTPTHIKPLARFQSPQHTNTHTQYTKPLSHTQHKTLALIPKHAHFAAFSYCDHQTNTLAKSVSHRPPNDLNAFLHQIVSIGPQHHFVLPEAQPHNNHHQNMAGLPADGCSLSVVVVGLLLLAAGGRHTEAHTYHTGECPSVEPMSGFDMSQVKGSLALV